MTDVVSSEEDVDASVYDSDDSYDMEGLDGALDDLMAEAEEQAGLDEGDVNLGGRVRAAGP